MEAERVSVAAIVRGCYFALHVAPHAPRFLIFLKHSSDFDSRLNACGGRGACISVVLYNPSRAAALISNLLLFPASNTDNTPRLSTCSTGGSDGRPDLGRQGIV
jgi:hypothetical protein